MATRNLCLGRILQLKYNYVLIYAAKDVTILPLFPFQCVLVNSMP